MTIQEARESGKPYRRKSENLWLIWKDGKDYLYAPGIPTIITLFKKDEKATDWETKQ